MTHRLRAAFVLLTVALTSPTFAADILSIGIGTAANDGTGDPLRTSMQKIMTAVNGVGSCFAGSSAPVSPMNFQCWYDTSSAPPIYKTYDSTQWVEVGELNQSTHVFTPQSLLISRSANTFLAGPISGASAPPTFRPFAVNDFNLGTGASALAFWRGDMTWAPIPYGCAPAITFGLVADGTTDNVAAFNSWFTGLSGNSGCLAFAGGVYKFNSAIAKTLGTTQSIKLIGAGLGTELWSSGAHGLFSITYAARVSGFNNNAGVLGVSNLSITTDQTNTQTGLLVNGANVAGSYPPPTIIENVAFTGHSNTTGWQTATDFEDVSYVFIDKLFTNFACGGLTCTNTSVLYNGTSGATIPVVLRVMNSSLNHGGYGVKATGRYQGIQIYDNDIVYPITAVSCTDTSADPQCDVMRNEINTYGIAIIQSDIIESKITDNFFLMNVPGIMAPDTPTIQITNGSRMVISGNHFAGNDLGGATYPGGVKFIGTSRSDVSANTYDKISFAINFDATSTHNRGTSCNNIQTVTPNAAVDAGSNNSWLYCNDAVPFGMQFGAALAEFTRTPGLDFTGANTLIRAKNGAAGTNLAIEFPEVTSGFSAAVRLFRTSPVGSASALQIYKGDTTTSIQTNFTAFGDSYTNAQAGCFGIGTASCSAKATIAGDASVTTHFRNLSGVPAASACGTSPAVTTNSTNSSGQFTTGTGTPTACTITFANAYPTAAFCTVSSANAAAAGAAVLPYISASSASAFTVTLAVGTDSAAFNYVCIGK